MPPNPNHLIRFNARCPVCEQTYDMQHLRILGERDQQVLTYIDCANCSTAMLSILSISPQGMTAQGAVTDLTPEEVIDSEELKPVSAEDVLLIHQYLDSGGQPLFPRKTL